MFGPAEGRTYLATFPVPGYVQEYGKDMHKDVIGDRVHPDMHALLAFQLMQVPLLPHLCNWSAILSCQLFAACGRGERQALLAQALVARHEPYRCSSFVLLQHTEGSRTLDDGRMPQSVGPKTVEAQRDMMRREQEADPRASDAGPCLPMSPYLAATGLAHALLTPRADGRMPHHPCRLCQQGRVFPALM